MARTLLERMQDWRWWILEQLLGHFVALGALPSAVVLALIHWGVQGALPPWAEVLVGLLTGAIVAVIYEASQRPIESWGDTLADGFSISNGGLASGLVFAWAI